MENNFFQLDKTVNIFWSTSNPSNTQPMATPERASDNPEKENVSCLTFQCMFPLLLWTASSSLCQADWVQSSEDGAESRAQGESRRQGDGEFTQNYYKKMEIPQVASDPQSYSVPLGFTPTQALLVIHCLNITCYQWLPRHSDIPLHLQLSLVSRIL